MLLRHTAIKMEGDFARTINLAYICTELLRSDWG